MRATSSVRDRTSTFAITLVMWASAFVVIRHVAHDVASAEESGVRGTPTFFIGDTRHIGPHDARTLIEALESSQAAPRPIG